MRILVTGAAGFAGKYIIRYLLNKGHVVTGLYRNNMPTDVSGCRLFQQDISKKIELSDQFDAIIHTACAHPNKENTFHIFKRDNIDSMEQLINFAHKNLIHIIVNLSTKNVYGKTLENDIKEESDIANQDLYGLSKYAAECLLREADDIQGLSLRLPGLVGQEAHDIWLVKMVEKIKCGENVVVSDIVTRNFVWVEDLAVFVEKVIVDAVHQKNFLYNTVNLACLSGSSNVEIVETIKRRIGSSSRIIVQFPRFGAGNLDASKAFEMGYCSPTPLQIVNQYLTCLGFPE